MTPGRAGVALVILAVGLGATAAPAQKPRVKVEFRLQEPTYMPEFTGAERRRLEDSAAAMLEHVLADHLAFLSFHRADTAAYTLVLELNRKDRESPGEIVEVGLHAALVDEARDTTRLYWLVFRPVDAALQSVGTVEELLTEIGRKLDRLVDAHWTHLVGGLLSRIPIADTGAVWGSPTEWIIPYRREDLCLDPQSVLRVHNVLRTPTGPDDLRITVVARGIFDPDPSVPLPPELERLRAHIRAIPAQPLDIPPDHIQVRAVFVVEYRFDRPSCPRLRRPSAEDFPSSPGPE